MTASDVELIDVHFAFPSVQMHFNLAVKRSTITIITGPSGSGKSTLLNLIAGFETPISGEIRLSGENMSDYPPSKRPLAMLFQASNLFDHLSAEANVGLGIRPNLKLNSDEKNRVLHALTRVGLTHKCAQLAQNLSGGERQRVAFARILVQNHPILLLDEPFASLGPASRREMMELLSQLQRENQLTVLAVTHHPNEWVELSDGFVFIENGRVAAQGSMDKFNLSQINSALNSYL